MKKPAPGMSSHQAGAALRSRLVVRREVIRELSTHVLANVVGGVRSSTSEQQRCTDTTL
jgi:hypothetical protein